MLRSYPSGLGVSWAPRRLSVHLYFYTVLGLLPDVSKADAAFKCSDHLEQVGPHALIHFELTRRAIVLGPLDDPLGLGKLLSKDRKEPLARPEVSAGQAGVRVRTRARLDRQVAVAIRQRLSEDGALEQQR